MMFEKGVIAIDPGTKGAIAFITPEREIRGLIDMPRRPHPQAKKGSKRTVVNLSQIMMQLDHWGLIGVDDEERPRREKVNGVLFVLEQQQYMPDIGKRGGARASAIILEEYGKLYGLLTGIQAMFRPVHPRTWQAKLLAKSGNTKADSIERAMQMFPGVDLVGEYKGRRPNPKDGRADAVNLADYGLMFLIGELYGQGQ